MKNIILLIVCLFSFNVLAQKKAVGVMLGSPTGLSYYQGYKDNIAFDLGLDYRLGSDLQVHSTYLLLQPDEVLLFGQVMGWYYGAGLRVKRHEKSDKDETRFGIRGSAGLLWELPEKPFELFAEASLVMNILPGTSVDIGAAVGARYKF